MMQVDALSGSVRFQIEHLHQPDGWLAPGFIEIDGAGFITAVSGERPVGWAGDDVQQIAGYVVPGMPNLHSHAHQRGLAGRAEGGSGVSEAENFWSWRTRMYAFLLTLTPEQFAAIAAQLYLEMLLSGFTTVGEFHYLHQDPDGKPYADPHEMSARLLDAAAETGIAMALLPSYYAHSGIDRPLGAEQRRFGHTSVEAYLDLVTWAQDRQATYPSLSVGLAPHSLRAVGAEELREIVAFGNARPDLPIHMHVAEQVREVEETVAGLGMTPAQWLIEHQPLDDRWVFIHSTHCTDTELAGMAQRGVVVGLCPTTEGNLGDGRFPLQEWDRHDGQFGIGTDANLLLDPALELRTLEYGQRLFTQRRSIIVRPGPTTQQPGRRLYDLALAGGTQALRQPIGALTPGHRADLVVLDGNHPSTVAQQPETILDAWLIAGTPALVRDVMVAGRWVVKGGHHPAEEAITNRYLQTMRQVIDQAL